MPLVGVGVYFEDGLQRDLRHLTVKLMLIIVRGMYLPPASYFVISSHGMSIYYLRQDLIPTLGYSDVETAKWQSTTSNQNESGT